MNSKLFKGGTGKNIIYQFAWHSNLFEFNDRGELFLPVFEQEDFFVPLDAKFDSKFINNYVSKKYILVITNTGNQASTKHYKYWDEIIDNVIKNLDENVVVVQGGLETDKKLKNNKVVDMRGKTKEIAQFNQLIKNSELVLTVDSYPMHVAHILGVSTIALFGSTHIQCSGMNYIDGRGAPKFICIENNFSLDHPCLKGRCYKNTCKFNSNCIDLISPQEIFDQIQQSKISKLLFKSSKNVYEKKYPTVSGYTTIYNGINAKLPIIESIESVLPYCDEVIVVDGESTDGTWELLNNHFKGIRKKCDQYVNRKGEYDPCPACEQFTLLCKVRNYDKVKLFQKKYDMDIPGIDGQQKAFARALCSMEFCLQFDADQIFEDGEVYKIKDLIRDFPNDKDLMHFPVIDYFGEIESIKNNQFFISSDYHMWKWFLSKNQDYITHGINKYAKIVDQQTGKEYSKPNSSDGCEMIHVITGEFIPHFGPWTGELDRLRIVDPVEYGKRINKLYKEWPKFHHTSWLSIERKIEHFVKFWDLQWSLLYGDSKEKRTKRWFDGIPEDQITKEMIREEAKKLFEQGGCHLQEGEKGILIPLDFNPPEILSEWIQKILKEYE